MPPKTEKPETYPLTEKKFTQFAKALVSVPKKELDKKIAKHGRKKAQAKPRAK